MHTHRNGTTTRKRLAAGTGAASTNQGGPSCGGYPSRHAVHWVAVQSVTRTIVNTTRIRPHRILVAVSAPSTTVRSDPVSRRALRGRPFRLPDRRSRSWHRDRPRPSGHRAPDDAAANLTVLRPSSVRTMLLERPAGQAEEPRRLGRAQKAWRQAVPLPASSGWSKATMVKQPGAGG